MTNAFDALVALLGVFFVVFTAMIDKQATLKVAVVAIAVYVGYKIFFAKQVMEENRKYHASKKVTVKAKMKKLPINMVKKVSGKRGKRK